VFEHQAINIMAFISLMTLLTGLALPTAFALAAWTCQFIWLHFIHKSQLERYLDNNGATNSTWALVTGASDGIGFGFVQELAAHGFNIILHGRNKSKLEGLVSQVQEQYPTQQFRIFVLDVSQRDDWQDKFKEFVSELKTWEINLKVLVNNVGGSGGNFFAFDRMTERDPDAIIKTIDVNATFPTAVTHILLPQLVQNKPALVINIGSVVAAFPPPYLALYAASKAFNMTWSDSLGSEMGLEKTDVEVLSVLVGRVINAATKHKVGSLFEPTPRNFARATLGKVGCGLPSVTAYWPHEVQITALRLMPTWIRRKVLADAAVKAMAEERRNR
jgi:17beta-estradiol 17-dehydrogenase / very-long-chain 3-oxoacyl-CoA reductase